MRVRAVLIAGALLVAGCSSVSGSWGNRSAISIAGGPRPNVGTLFIWSDDSNAAVLTTDGKVCMQRAMTANAESIGVNADLSDAILKLAGPVAAAGDAGSTSQSDSLLAVTTALSQSVTSLSTTTERTALLDIGLFYICQLGANSSVTDAQATQLTAALFESVAAIQPVSQGAPVTVQAGTPSTVRQSGQPRTGNGQ